MTLPDLTQAEALDRVQMRKVDCQSLFWIHVETGPFNEGGSSRKVEFWCNSRGQGEEALALVQDGKATLGSLHTNCSHIVPLIYEGKSYMSIIPAALAVGGIPDGFRKCHLLKATHAVDRAGLVQPLELIEGESPGDLAKRLREAGLQWVEVHP